VLPMPELLFTLQVNSFVGAFHDAVILYAQALNDTLAEGEDPRNGTAVTRRMWNRTFKGKHECLRHTKSQTPLHGHRLRTPATNTTNSQQFYNKFTASQCQSPTSRHVKMLGCGDFYPLVVFVAGVRIAGVRVVEFGSKPC